MCVVETTKGLGVPARARTQAGMNTRGRRRRVRRPDVTTTLMLMRLSVGRGSEHTSMRVL